MRFKNSNLERSVDTGEEWTDERMTETVSRSGEFIENSSVAIRIVSFVVAFSEEIEAVEINGVPAEYSRKVFVVNDVLPDGTDYFAAGHVKSLVIPLTVECLELSSDPVVFTEHHRMKDAQTRILRCARISSVKAKAGSGLAFGQTAGLRQKIATAEWRYGDIHPAASEGPESLRFTGSLSVDVREVEVGGIHVDLFSGSKTLLAGQGSSERHADGTSSLQVDFREERIVARDGNGPAFRMDVGWRIAVATVQDGVLINRTEVFRY